MSSLRRVLTVALMTITIGLTPHLAIAQFGSGGGASGGGASGGGAPGGGAPGDGLPGGVQVRSEEPTNIKTPISVESNMAQVPANYPSIPADLIREVQKGRAIEGLENDMKANLIRNYLESGLPIPNFAVPTGLLLGSGNFSSPQTRAIGKLLKYLDTFPAARIEAVEVLHIGNLNDRFYMLEKFDWNQLDIALRYGVYSAMMRKVPLEKIHFMSANELKLAADEQRKLLAPHYPTGSRINVYPVSVGERPVVEVVPPREPTQEPGIKDDLGSIMITGGDPAGDPSGGELPVANAGTSPIVIAANEIAADAGNTNLEKSGEPGYCSDDERPCFLSTVALHDTFRLRCTGTLITSDKVLTAAHCVCNGVPSLATIGSSAPLGVNPPNAERLTVALRPNAQFMDSKICQTYQERSQSPTTYVDGDLAVVTLSEGLQPGNRSPFAVLAAKSRLPDIAQIEIVGFGARDADPLGGEKYSAPVIVASAQCDGELSMSPGQDDPEFYGCNRGRELVAIDQSSFLADSCYGDSGGGAHVRLSDDTYVLVAVVSRGLGKTCGRGGIYTLVVTDRVKAWLREVAPATKIEAGDVPLAHPKLSSETQGG